MDIDGKSECFESSVRHSQKTNRSTRERPTASNELSPETPIVSKESIELLELDFRFHKRWSSSTKDSILHRSKLIDRCSTNLLVAAKRSDKWFPVFFYSFQLLSNLSSSVEWVNCFFCHATTTLDWRTSNVLSGIIQFSCEILLWDEHSRLERGETSASFFTTFPSIIIAQVKTPHHSDRSLSFEQSHHLLRIIIDIVTNFSRYFYPDVVCRTVWFFGNFRFTSKIWKLFDFDWTRFDRFSTMGKFGSQGFDSSSTVLDLPGRLKMQGFIFL